MQRHAPWCFGAGVIVFHLLPRTPAFGWTLVLLLLVPIALRVRLLRWLLPCVLGFAWCWLRVDLRLAERWPAPASGHIVAVEGVVSAPAKVLDGALQCVLDIDQV